MLWHAGVQQLEVQVWIRATPGLAHLRDSLAAPRDVSRLDQRLRHMGMVPGKAVAMAQFDLAIYCACHLSEQATPAAAA